MIGFLFKAARMKMGINTSMRLYSMKNSREFLDILNRLGYKYHSIDSPGIFKLAKTKNAIEFLNAILDSGLKFHPCVSENYARLARFDRIYELICAIAKFNMGFDPHDEKSLTHLANAKNPMKLFELLKKNAILDPVLFNYALGYLEYAAYFFSHVSHDHECIGLMEKGKEYIIKRIENDLEGRDHTIREFTSYEESHDVYDTKKVHKRLEKLRVNHLLRIVCLLKAIGRAEFRKQIADEIKKDMNDPYNEHGGLIVTKGDNNLKLKPYISALAVHKKEEYNNAYLLPKEAERESRFCEYHLHATSWDDTFYAGPSEGDFITGGDLAAGRLKSHHKGRYTMGVVITKIYGENFNVDAYFCAPGEHFVIDLGNYGYG